MSVTNSQNHHLSFTSSKKLVFLPSLFVSIVLPRLVYAFIIQATRRKSSIMYNKYMSSLRTKLGNRLFKAARNTYDKRNTLRKELGDMLFKLAAKVSPDKK
jgi:hypothetical protein